MVQLKILLAFSLLLCVKFVSGDELKDFLTVKLANYSNWITANNYDPSPSFGSLVELDTKNALVDIDTKIWNQTVQGHSTNISVTNLIAGLGSLISIDFGGTGVIIYSGDYEAAGTLNYTEEDIPLTFNISGAGRWSILATNYNHLIQIHGFTVTPEGFVNISNARLTISGGSNKITENNFEGLLDGCGTDETCLSGLEYEMSNAYKKLLQKSITHPNNHLMMKYLTEIFEKTPVVEIPTTTVPTLPPSSTDKSTAKNNRLSFRVLVTAFIIAVSIRFSS